MEQIINETNSYSTIGRSEYNGGKNYFPFLYILFILISFYPYEFYSAFPILASSNQRVTYLFLTILTLVVSLFVRRKSSKIPQVLFVIVILQCFWMILNNLYKGRDIGLGAFITPILALTLVYFIHSSCGLFDFFKKYNSWILLMTSMGTVALLLVRAGLLRPIFPFIDFSDGDIMYNFGLTFSQRSEFYDFAYCGYFDEPGAIAQWSLFALLFNELFIKNKKIEVLLIVTTLFSFSMGYYIQIFVYILIFHVITKKKKNNRVFSLLIILITSIFVFWAMKTNSSQNEDVYYRTIDRIITAIDDSETQGLAVDDRATYTEIALSEFKQNPLMGTSKENINVGHNIYEPLALYGIVGTFFMYFPFLVLLIRSIIRQDYELLKCMIIIFMGFTHRPFHGNLLFYFIIYSFVVMCYDNNLKNYTSSAPLRRRGVRPENGTHTTTTIGRMKALAT